MWGEQRAIAEPYFEVPTFAWAAAHRLRLFLLKRSFYWPPILAPYLSPRLPGGQSQPYRLAASRVWKQKSPLEVVAASCLYTKISSHRIQPEKDSSSGTDCTRQAEPARVRLLRQRLDPL
ncbi:hypothetical protein Zmor_019137 [Zophobas morio]|jgi:hypothetical protein|uniref:Uncharacterized protein n=1 Tax=Zophobas morio TaxID=2755281 RepID=A0AA38M031_9CUCU|nr:hypothetical protein Zmor_019137 [Zophobas morio]